MGKAYCKPRLASNLVHASSYSRRSKCASTKLRRQLKPRIQLGRRMTSSTTIPSAPPTIVLHEDTFRQYTNGTITGIVLWRINGKAFPDEAWNDFVIVVLGWWAGAIIRLLSGNSTKETMDLMDGPYSLICEGSIASIRCRFVDRRKDHDVVAVWSGNTVDLAKQILTAGKTALRKCHQHNWIHPDIKNLEKEINTLRKMI